MRTIASLLSVAILALAAPVALAGSETETEDVELTSSGYLGIHLQRIEGGLAEALDMDEDSGVLVRQVEDDSPAAKAGLRAGDIVTRLDGDVVGDPSELRKAVRARNAGEEVKIRYLRDGKSNEITVTLAEADRVPRRLARKIHDKIDDKIHDKLNRKTRHVRELRFHGDHGFLGVTTQPLTGGLGEYFGVKENHGALVAEVVEDSPAEKLGLQSGDVIVKAADEKIEDPGHLSKVVRSYEEVETVEVHWLRDKKEKNGKVELEIRESGPAHWFDGKGLHDLDLGNLEFFGHRGDGVERRVEVHRFDEGTTEAMEELQEELRKLQETVKELQQKVK